jgi:F420-0:gamma-glutamyl ligase
MALSDHSDFPAFFHLRKMTYWNFINSGIQQSAVTPLPRKMALSCHVLQNRLFGIVRLRKVNVSVTESTADC